MRQSNSARDAPSRPRCSFPPDHPSQTPSSYHHIPRPRRSKLLGIVPVPAADPFDRAREAARMITSHPLRHRPDPLDHNHQTHPQQFPNQGHEHRARGEAGQGSSSEVGVGTRLSPRFSTSRGLCWILQTHSLALHIPPSMHLTMTRTPQTSFQMRMRMPSLLQSQWTWKWIL